MNVAIQDSDRAEFLQVSESLGAVFGSPAPLGIDRPQRNVCEDHDWCAGFEVLNVIFQPFELLVTEGSQSASFEVHYVDQADEVNSLLVEAVPAGAFRTFAISFQELLSIVFEDVMLTWHE